MICAYLLHRDRCKDADEVLNFYGQARTFNAKVGRGCAFATQSYAYVVVWCLSDRLSHSCIVSKRVNVSSNFFHHQVATQL